MFKPYQKFQSKLLEEIMDSRWADFVHLSESDKGSVLSAMLRTGSADLKGVADKAGASEWMGKVTKITEAITSLSRHCSRTTSTSLKRWLSFCEKTMSTFKASPTKKIFDLLERQAFHSHTLLEAVKHGKSVDGLSKELFVMVSSSMGAQGISLIESIVDHSKFVKGLEKEFDLTVVKYEPIRDGVFVYLDRESAIKLSNTVANSNTYINSIADEFGYLLLRKGSVPDVEYGSIGENLSCWMFVYAPVTDEKKVGGDTEVLSKKDFKTLKLSERWGH